MSFSNIAQDFIDLFTGKNSAHLSKYVHMHRPDVYDQVVNQNAYYPYRLECKLIADFAHEIAHDLPPATNIIEMGPGSASPVLAKSVPMIAAINKYCSVKFYGAVDINTEYALSACEIIKKNFEFINTSVINLDFTIPSELIKIRSVDSHIILCFGGTIFCAGTESDARIIIQNFSSLLKPGEYFIFGADISDNEQALEKAYFNDLSYQLMLNAMFGIKSAAGDKNFDAEAFLPVFKWNTNTTTVELFLNATKSQKIIINNEEYYINKDTKYNILNSRKTSVSEIEQKLGQYKIKIVDIFETKDNFGNKFALLKTRKI